MRNLHIITFLVVVGIILNITLPLLHSTKLTLFSCSQIIALFIIYIKAWVNSRGSQEIPIIVSFVIRVFQALICGLWLQQISLQILGYLVITDIVLLTMLWVDKASYRYELVALEDDEFRQ